MSSASELARCLRHGHTQRKSQGHVETRGRTKDMVMISERPPEVEDRAVPGHWEGDLVMGAGGRSAVGTLVERTTRFLLLLHLPDGKGAVEVEAAMRRAIATLPDELTKSITWDRGKEMARHAEFSIATKIPVYFCDPHSPWQRGSNENTNENTNGLLRQYLAGDRPVQAVSRRLGAHSTEPRRTPTRDPRIHDTIGATRRAHCAHRLNPPGFSGMVILFVATIAGFVGVWICSRRGSRSRTASKCLPGGWTSHR